MISLQNLPEITQHFDRQVHYAANNEAGGLWALDAGEEITLSTAAGQADELRLTVSNALNGDLEAVFSQENGETYILPIGDLDIKPTRILEIPLPPGLDPASFTLRATASARGIRVLAAAIIEHEIKTVSK